MKKGLHPENYRPVVFKDIIHHTRSTLVNLNWWIQQVVLISS